MSLTAKSVLALVMTLPFSALGDEHAYAEHGHVHPGEVIVLHAGVTPTKDATVYLAKVQTVVDAKSVAVEQARQTLQDNPPQVTAPKLQVGEPSLFPWQTTKLQSGTPMTVVRPGLLKPIFVIGMDKRSLTWLSTHLEQLKQIRAVGVVVQAQEWAAFAELRQTLVPRGIGLTLGSGDAIAAGYAIKTYPTLIQPESRP